MPALQDIHIVQALTNVSLQFGQGDFVAERLAPIVNVQKQSDKYFILDATREALRQQDTERAPGTPANISDFAVTSAQYNAKDHAQKSAITPEDRANVDPAIQTDIEKTEWVTEVVKVDKEIKLAAQLATDITQTTTMLTATTGALGRWDEDISDPIAAVENAVSTIVASVQKRPNTISIPFEVYQKLKNHPLIIERVKAGGTTDNPAIVNANSLAQVFDIENVLISSAYKNTATKGATASVSNIWSDTVYICIAPASPGLRTLSMAMTFAWNVAGATNGQFVRSWTDPEVMADFVEFNDYYDQKTTAATAGFKILDTIA